MIRKRFWIIKGRAAVKRTLCGCFSCRRWHASAGEQKMANLPQDRVTPNKPPFTYVGVDCFGPFLVWYRGSQAKRENFTFDCTCDLHQRSSQLGHRFLQKTVCVVLSLEGGSHYQIRSDNGGNFVRGEKELQNAIDGWIQEVIAEFLLQRNVQWILNPPAPPASSHPWSRTEHPRWTSTKIPYQQSTPWESCGFQRKTCLHLKEIRLKNTFSLLNGISWRESPHYLTPFIIRAKLKMQEMRVAGLEWDELYQKELVYKSQEWFCELEVLPKLWWIPSSGVLNQPMRILLTLLRGAWEYRTWSKKKKVQKKVVAWSWFPSKGRVRLAYESNWHWQSLRTNGDQESSSREHTGRRRETVIWVHEDDQPCASPSKTLLKLDKFNKKRLRCISNAWPCST